MEPEMPTKETPSPLRSFVEAIEEQASTKPRAKKFTVDRDSAIAAAAIVRGKIDAAALGGRKGKRGPKLTTRKAQLNRDRVKRHRAKKNGGSIK